MGQAYSKINSHRAHQPANASQSTLHQAISHPEPPRRLTHISELIDIDQLMRQGSIPTINPDSLFTKDLPTDDESTPVIIQSPSGNILSPQQYLERPDRVMTLEERKDLIRSNTERRIRVHESREGLRAEALRGKSRDEAREKEDVVVAAQEPAHQALADRKSFAPKRKPKKHRLGCFDFWSRWGGGFGDVWWRFDALWCLERCCGLLSGLLRHGFWDLQRVIWGADFSRLWGRSRPIPRLEHFSHCGKNSEAIVFQVVIRTGTWYSPQISITVQSVFYAILDSKNNMGMDTSESDTACGWGFE